MHQQEKGASVGHPACNTTILCQTVSPGQNGWDSSKVKVERETILEGCRRSQGRQQSAQGSPWPVHASWPQCVPGLLNGTSGISTHTHTQKERQLSQICCVLLQFFQSKALSATARKQPFCGCPGKGVQYLLFVTASNSKILKSQLSSLSRSCAIQGGTSVMVFGTERWLWLRFISVEMEFGNYNISGFFFPPTCRIPFRKQLFFKKNNSFPYMRKSVKAYNTYGLYYYRWFVHKPKRSVNTSLSDNLVFS